MDGVRYLSKYMPHASSKGYISVMLRIQLFAESHHFAKIQSDERKLQMLGDCVNSISNHVGGLKEKYGAESVFLTMDCRKHSSNIFRSRATLNLLELVGKVATTVYQWKLIFTRRVA